jgi:hypothetical protein
MSGAVFATKMNEKLSDITRCLCCPCNIVGYTLACIPGCVAGPIGGFIGAFSWASNKEGECPKLYRESVAGSIMIGTCGIIDPTITVQPS